MADKPIPFSGPMVRALMAGTKTQTRRYLDGWTDIEAPAMVDDGKVIAFDERDQPYRWPRTHAVGDRLWVRESWNWTFIKDLAPGETLGRTLDECCEANGGFACPVGDGIVYEATNAHEHPEHGKARWRPSTNLPRYASRITLTVTDVRVQRLQDISEVDAVAEGARLALDDRFLGGPLVQTDTPNVFATPRNWYRDLWDSINGAGSWDANPWVAAYTFTVAMGNIDQIGGAANA